MKRAAIFLLCTALCCCIMGGCGARSGNTSNVRKSTAAANTTLSENELISILYTKLGNENPETGGKYRFTYYQAMEIDGETYYRFQWDELDISETDEDGDPGVTVVGGVYVSENGEHIYRGTFSPEKGTSKLGEQLF